MPLKLHLDDARKLAELHVYDRVTWEAFHGIAPVLEDFVLQHRSVRMLEVIDHFEGLDPDLLWEGLRLDRKILPHITHCAFVGERRWLNPLERARNALLPTKLRLFDSGQERAARQWLMRVDRVRAHVIARDPGNKPGAASHGGRLADTAPAEPHG